MDDIMVATYICYVQSIVIICFMDLVLVGRVVSGDVVMCDMVTFLTVAFTDNLMYDQPSIASSGLLYCLWSVYRCSGLTLI